MIRSLPLSALIFVLGFTSVAQEPMLPPEAMIVRDGDGDVISVELSGGATGER